MISVDTNVLVRLLTRDDETQYRKARKTFKTGQIFIPDTVILETEWVLRYVYSFDSGDILEALRKTLGLPNVNVSDPLMLETAIRWCESGMHFADALHLAKSQDCEKFASFDTALAQTADQAKGSCPVEKL